MKKLWDISPPIHAASPVFPGDTAYSQQWVANIGPGCPVNVSAITLSPPVGAHADAPLHYDPTGAAIGVVDLQAFLGPCRVIHAIGCGPLVRPEHLQYAMQDLPPRVRGAETRNGVRLQFLIRRSHDPHYTHRWARDSPSGASKTIECFRLILMQTTVASEQCSIEIKVEQRRRTRSEPVLPARSL